MKAFWFLLITVHAVTGQAPGDEDQLCFTVSTREPFVNQIVLMSSLNYINLLESDGGPWAVLNEDDNNDGRTFSSQTNVRNVFGFILLNRCFSGRHQAQVVAKALLYADFRLAHRAIGSSLNLSITH